MADTNLLAALLSGSNPLAPQMLGGYQGAQLSDAALNPAFAHNEGPFGALAKTLAGFSGAPMLRQAVEATTAARTGANPELARMLAGNDPFTMAAAPGANPIAVSQILAGATPASAAAARLADAQARFMSGKVDQLNAPDTGAPMLPSTSGGRAAAPSALPVIAAPTTGRAPAVDSLTEIANLAPEARAEAIAKIADPRARAALMARLARMRGANAARP
jgi:hypothetical protein